MRFRTFFAITIAGLQLLYFAPLVCAEAAKDFPNRPIRLIVPNAAGSSVDILGRIVANKLSGVVGQQVVVDNRAGAGGVVGMEIGKNANSDGYTVISASTPAMSVAPHIQKKLPYDPLNDFAFISQFAMTPNVLVVTPGLPIKSVKDLIDYAKLKQGQVNMAHAGAGSQIHMSGMYFMSIANFPSLPVPYKGGGRRWPQSWRENHSGRSRPPRQ